eukprot:4632016-Pleurochrysis_carterae.AAC.1
MLVVCCGAGGDVVWCWYWCGVVVLVLILSVCGRSGTSGCGGGHNCGSRRSSSGIEDGHDGCGIGPAGLGLISGGIVGGGNDNDGRAD